MSTAAMVPVTISREALAFIDRLGQREELEAMIDRARHIVPGLRSIEVVLDAATEEMPAGIVLWTHRDDIGQPPRKVRETRSSSSQKRSEPAALRGQGGNEHGGSPWFQGGVEPGRAPAGVGRKPVGCPSSLRSRTAQRPGASLRRTLLAGARETWFARNVSLAPVLPPHASRPLPSAENWVRFPARSRLRSS